MKKKLGADKELIRKRFEANFHQYHRLALVQKEICAELAELTAEFCDPVGIRRALEIGAGTGFLSSHLLSLFPSAKWHFNDISEAARSYVSKYSPHDATFLWGDAESVDFPREQDLIASASTVQWFDDMPRFAERAAEVTNTGGWLVMSTFGPDNFREIRHTTGEGLDYYTLADLGRILRDAGYELLSSREYIRTMHFSSPLEVLHHIKATGVNSLGRTRWGRRQFADFDKQYRAAYSANSAYLDTAPSSANSAHQANASPTSPSATILSEGVALTYHPILLVARKK